MSVTARNLDQQGSYTRYMLVADDEEVNIEVFVLCEYLKERLGLEFKPRGREK
jgi:hypothetical protein